MSSISNNLHTISGGIKQVLHGTVCLLNQEPIKESIKNIAGSVTFLFGLVGLYDISQIGKKSLIRKFNGGKFIRETEEISSSFPWMQQASKIQIICAKISLLLSASVSRAGILVISSLAGRVFSTAQLDKFGPNTTFAINPWHPRHVISIAAVIFALPTIAQSICESVNWARKKISFYPDDDSLPLPSYGFNHWLTDSKLRLIVLFNTATSRPLLHLGNRLSRYILRTI